MRQQGERINNKVISNYQSSLNSRANGFTDGTDWKTDEYESDTFVQEMEETWQGLKPLYQQLHAYVRDKLVKR